MCFNDVFEGAAWGGAQQATPAGSSLRVRRAPAGVCVNGRIYGVSVLLWQSFTPAFTQPDVT